MMRTAILPSVFRQSGFTSIRSLSSFSQADLPTCNFKPEKYTGLSSDALNEIRKQHVHPAIIHYYKTPLHVNQGHMQYLYDVKGQRYIDFFGGIVTVSVGHCHPKVLTALERQAGKLWHTSTIYNYESLMLYVKKLAGKFPKPLDVVYLVNSGSEANDLALLMARMHTGSQDIVSLRKGYHGLTGSIMALTALGNWRHDIPLAAGHHHTICPDVYRGPWGGKDCRTPHTPLNRDCDCVDGQCKASDAYVADVADVLLSSCHQSKMAGFISETIQGVGGVVQLPRNYLKRVFELVRARGGLCITDEVQTGFGRCGDTYWGFETQDVVPDIVTMAKSIGNGFPLAAVITSKEVAAPLAQSLHFNTYGGNPMASAVGKAVLEVIDEEKLQDHCRVLGTHILKRLAKLQKKHPAIGDIRGMGLMLGIELVADPVTRVPLDGAKVNDLMESMREKFVLVGKSGVHSNVIRFKPPMCIKKADADYMLEALDVSLTELGL